MQDSRLGMVLLVGEQPAPNLLPVRHFRPSRALLAFTQRTAEVAGRLEALLTAEGVASQPLEVKPYDVADVEGALRAAVRDAPGVDWIANVTGGTKPMAIAAVRAAERAGWPWVYLQSEGGENLLYVYRPGVDAPERVSLQETITLDDYLRLHWGGYSRRAAQDPFEQAVAAALRDDDPQLEVLTGVCRLDAANVEIDLVVRWGNQVGFAEVTAQRRGFKDKIDQLNSATGQTAVGTYAKKFLVVTHGLDRNNEQLAAAYGVHVITLAKWNEQSLGESDRQELRSRVRSALAPRHDPA